MALNIRKVTAQRTENIQKIIKKTISTHVIGGQAFMSSYTII